MKVTLIQSDLHWENREKNLEHLGAHISNIKEQTDLIVLPEMFATGFTMAPEKLAEPADGPSIRWMKKIAKDKNAVICGSLAVEEKGKYYNRFYWVGADGESQTYNKRHLFRMGGEDEHYTAGNSKLIIKKNEWKICPLVCYDLRFPVWSRNKFSGSWDYDLLIYVANWPEVRNNVWKQLLVARAIENQCYVIGLNRIGKDKNDFNHSGDSVVLNAKGEAILSIQPNKEMIETVQLDLNALADFRKNFPVGLDADEFELKY